MKGECECRWEINYLDFWSTDLLSDLQASMLSGFRFHSRVNSSLTIHSTVWISMVWCWFRSTNWNFQIYITDVTYFPIKILRSGPFPRKSSGACLFRLGLLDLSSTVLFKTKTSRHIFINSLSLHTKQSLYKWIKWDALPFLDEARTALVFPRIPVLLCVEDMLQNISGVISVQKH